jgi:CheY-like chemotaxis protein
MFTKIDRSVQGTNEGLGVGLALSRRLAELHGGTLTARSEGEGKGATFTLMLPAASVNGVRSEKARTPSDAPASASGSASKLKVVLVEDNEESAEMMRIWLEHLGHAVDVAHTGPDGLALILQARPDVVFCDIGLPGMDGVDVCRGVVRGLPQPPVMVAITGWGSESDRSRTVDAGFRHHLVKPVEPDKLRELLDSIGPS